MSIKRIYAVTTPTGIRLVNATSQAQALAHVARSTFAVAIARPHAIVEAMTAGVKVETAGEGSAA